MEEHTRRVFDELQKDGKELLITQFYEFYLRTKYYSGNQPKDEKMGEP